MKDNIRLLKDDFGVQIMDTRMMVHKNNETILKNNEIIPEKIRGKYREDYNIIYIDNIIKKKLEQEYYTKIPKLETKLNKLKIEYEKPQTYIIKKKIIDEIMEIECKIKEIKDKEIKRKYEERTEKIIEKYKKNKGDVKTIVFDIEDEKYKEMDEKVKKRILIIEKYLEIAKDFLDIEIIRIDNKPKNRCKGCGEPLEDVPINDMGTIRCPNNECLTEHEVLIKTKSRKDGNRILSINNNDDESIENFMRAFNRYQGLQSDKPNNKLFEELDEYFIRHGRPIGEEIKKCKLNRRGRTGDTNHKMLWTALSQINRSEYYEDANLIGHMYWGWTLPNVMQYKEKIIQHYNKTQKVFYQIPIEERSRNSSLGTQYRLWRHLQMVGHECYIDEFKIAENAESLRTHDKLWRQMCKGTNDPEIQYIP